MLRISCCGLVLLIGLLLAPTTSMSQLPAQLIRQHRYADALETLAVQQGDEVARRLVRAELCRRLARWQCVGDALQGEPEGLPEGVQERWVRLKAHGLVRAGRFGEAVVEFRRQGFPHNAQTRGLLGESLVSSGAFADAARVLREVIRVNHASVDSFAARLLLVDALRGLGQESAAGAELVEAYVRHPAHPEADELLSLEDLSVPERLIRAERLAAAGEHLQAATELEQEPEGLAREVRARWLHQRGMGLFRARGHYARAADVLAEAARLGGSNAEHDAFHAARALSRADRDEDAVHAYDAFRRRYASSRRAAEAEFLAGWLSLRHGFGDGSARLRRLSERRRAPAVWRTKAAWLVAFADFDQGRYSQAAQGFTALRDTESRGMKAGRAWYWSARAEYARGRHRAAYQAWRRAIEIEPLQWYGLLSAARLRSHEQELPTPFGASEGEVLARSALEHGGEETLTSRSAPFTGEPAFWHRWGFDAEAATILRGEFGSQVSGRALAEAVQRLTQVGDTNRAFILALRRARGLLREAPRASNGWAWNAALPMPWYDQISEAGSRFDVTPSYLYGLMRQESAFAPAVESYAGARGLLQLMPETAARVASRVGVEITDDMLFLPSANILLGAAYCGELLREFSGVEALAIGAYNAGSHRIRAWLRSSGQADLDRFVEEIPINQTRNYVRRVSTHQARYRFFESPDSGWPALPPLRVGPDLIQPPYTD